MEPYEEPNSSEKEKPYARLGANRWLAGSAVAFLALAGIAASYGFHEQGQVDHLKDQAATANNSVSQLQAQVNTLTARLNDMNAAQPAAAPSAPPGSLAPVADNLSVPTTAAPAVVASTKPAPARQPTTKRRPAVDKRYAQLKNQLDEEQKQLKETQDEVARNRADLEGSISSTKEELNGSIAKTHEELVALEKRGERSYFEFDLSKSKQFQRFGPLTLSLRRVDSKHKNYDLAMIVDDNELTKKKVNLYEPIWIHTENGAQPLQVVVNRVERNVVHGYVSAPKYKESELSALSPATASPSTGEPQTPAQPRQ